MTLPNISILQALVDDQITSVTFTPSSNTVLNSATTGAGCTAQAGQTSGNVAGYKYGFNATCAVAIKLTTGWTMNFTVHNDGTGSGTSFTGISISRSPTTTTVAASSNPAVYGQSVTETVTVASSVGTPQGTVNFGSGPNLTLSSGMASRQVTVLQTASDTAVYGDSNGYTGSSGGVTVTVIKASTTTTLAANPNPADIGQGVTLTATVARVAPSTGGAAPGGTVIFFDGSTQVASATPSNGVASATVAPPVAGIHSLTAVYAGDGNFNGSTSAAASVVAHARCADTFGSAAALTGANGSAFGTTLGATGESGEPNHAGNSGTLNSVWCKWTAPQSGSVTFDTTGSGFDTTLASYTGGVVSALTQVAANDNIAAGNNQSRLTFYATSGTAYMIAIDGAFTATGNYVLNWAQADPAAPAVFASILPSARSVTTGTVATAFATMINASSSVANSCSLAAPSGFPATFGYQITNASNQPTGTANTPKDIAAGAAQSFVFAVTPLIDLNAADLAVVFNCTNKPTTVTVSGLNTLLLSASSIPPADLISIGATPSGDGILNIPGNTGATAFAASAVNIGANGTIIATIDDNGKNLALTPTLCQSNPATAACTNPASPATSATLTVNTNDVVTFTIFVTGTGAVPFDPANNRLFLRLKTSDGVTRGATSVAVRTQ